MQQTVGPIHFRSIRLFLTAGCSALALLLAPGGSCAAQAAAQRRAAQLAYQAEMDRVGRDCPDSVTLTDRNECLNSVRRETYANFDAFFSALREILIEDSPNDANALALDGGETAWEKYRTASCDAMVRLYDIGSVKNPGSTQPSAQTRCLIQLTRSRMRDLMELYQPGPD